jgi:predicted SnoaL-like aldol condensation-catalyzing enzyme
MLNKVVKEIKNSVTLDLYKKTNKKWKQHWNTVKNNQQKYFQTKQMPYLLINK